MTRRCQAAPVLVRLFILPVAFGVTLQAAEKPAPNPQATFKQYCYACHGKAAATAGINLEQLTATGASVGNSFQHWEKVAAALETHRMPPRKMPQPSEADRDSAVAWIRARLSDYATKHAGDPGRVTVRRLTSAEYAYTIRDLTGVDMKFEGAFASDSVGGEGFMNFGDVQFMDDANLERYLETAKIVADHAVIGSGPLQFYQDPGQSGMELSAIHRIQDIYTTHGFRAASAEGGRPYGLERYAQAFYVCWQYQHRQTLGQPKASLEDFARREGISGPFTRHIWTVVQQPSPSYPTSEVVSRWRKFPAPTAANRKDAETAARAGSTELQQFVINWPRWLFAAGALAAGGQGDERALVITDASLEATSKHSFRFLMRRGRGETKAKVYLSVVRANPHSTDQPVIVWHNATVRFRGKDRSSGTSKLLKDMLDEATAQRFGFGKRPDGGAIEPGDFATVGDATLEFEIPVPAEAGGFSLQADAEMLPGGTGSSVMRCTIAESAEGSKGRPAWALMGQPDSPGFKAWKQDVLAYAAKLPQTSHSEPTPADRDDIPAPFNNAYNQPERDRFHVQLKYNRSDRFLVENMLDEPARRKLDQAWADLLTSFDYHETFFRFVVEKLKVDVGGKHLADLSPAEIEAIPEEPRRYVQALRTEYDAMTKAVRDARPGQVEDCLKFAARAWRRPLTESEKESLRSFYRNARTGPELDHPKAIRLLLTRILMAPPFLYRVEQPPQDSGIKPLSDWEVANRLSYFLWSSMPDDELRRAATAGKLSQPKELEQQVKRMLADGKSRRLATEFFGQWLGFYRFDEYRGVDARRFPEFTEDVKDGMYEEAVSFFEHIIRQDRPVREMFSADYTFLTPALARHYGVTKEIPSGKEAQMVEGAGAFHRGGMLRLGAVLTATSAPLRTSPVKRGDWILRRVLGTPTPPPPPDAGSIPADPKMFAGMTLRERLASHQRNATCASCHTRIDPLGFPLESYDSIGRWRQSYDDGKPVDNSSALSDKTEINGVDGLLDYLKTQDRQVLKNFSHKLLGYALGRTVLASDQALLDRMAQGGTGTPFSKFVTEIVTSRQFRYRRGLEDSAPVTSQSVAPQQSAQVKKENKEGGL